MLFYATEQVSIEWDEENKIIVSMHKGFVSGEDYRIASNKLLELAILKKAKKYIADGSQAKLISVADQQWIIEDWLPRAIEAGLRYNANILPRSILAQMALNAMGRNAGENPIEAHYFSNREDALAWLKSLP